MRLLFLLLCLSCAAKQSTPTAPSPTAMDEVQTRACESCRHDLEICRRADTTVSGGVSSRCMDQFMSCLELQKLDHARCSGLN